MPLATALPAPDIIYPVDISWPTAAFNDSVVGTPGSGSSVNNPNEFSGLAPAGIDALTANSFSDIDFGGTGGTGEQRNYRVSGGLLMGGVFGSGAVTISQHFGIPSFVPPLDPSGLAAGYVNPEWLRVAILDTWLAWPLAGGAGIFNGNLQGIQFIANAGVAVTINQLLTAQGGGTDPRVMFGVYGRNDGGTQQAQYRSFDVAETLLETVPITLADATVANWYRWVFVSAAPGRAATLSLHVNDELTPLLTRTFGTAVLPSVLSWNTVPRQSYGLAWGALTAAAGGISRGQFLRWRLRLGRHLPDGTEITS